MAMDSTAHEARLRAALRDLPDMLAALQSLHAAGVPVGNALETVASAIASTIESHIDEALESKR
jgi:pilus assembly protein TadC